MRKTLADTHVVACMARGSGLARLMDRIGREQGLRGLGFFSLLDSV